MSADSHAEVDEKTVEWILKSPKKLEILRSLKEDKQTPSQLAEEFDVKLETMCSHLRELRKNEQPVVEELTGRRRDRIYGLTSAGEVVLAEIEI
jgi:predicted transcriptional regulator